MNLRDLQYLCAVAEHLHFGKAANECNVSQPTLSMQLKKLEDTLGVLLFERTNKSVMLTHTGRAIAARARTILEETRQLRAEAEAARNPLAGEVRLGIFPTLAPYLLPSFLPVLKEHLAALELMLVEEKTAELVARLERGDIDCALLAMPVAHEQFTVARLFAEPFLLAVPSDHRLAARTKVKREDIKQDTILLLEEGHCLREQALEVCSTIGVGESKRFRATSLETLRHMVAAGSAVTLMPRLAAFEGDPLVRYIPFADPAPSRTIGLYWRKTSPRSAVFERIAALASATYDNRL